MKAPSFQLCLASALLLLLPGLGMLATSCGQDATTKKRAAETEAHVMATIKQVLGQNPAQSRVLDEVHTWYQSSEVPNIIKLAPHAASIYEDHATLLNQVATTQPKLLNQPILSADQAQSIRNKYLKLVEESTANVQELTNLASNQTTMSEAEQRQFVAALATKENRQLQLVQYYGKRTQAAIDQKVQQQNHHKYMQQTWGLE